MFYYHFKFKPETDKELTQVNNMLSHIKSFRFVAFAQDQLVVAKSDVSIGKEIFEFAKNNFTQNFEVEIQSDEPREGKIVQYHYKTGAIVTHYLIPFFEASYMYDIFNK